jgi:hypothetical protein
MRGRRKPLEETEKSMVAASEEPNEPHELTPEEAHAWMQYRTDIKFVGGPKCGDEDKDVQVFKPPYSRVFFINRNLCHYYTLDGDTDKGFTLKYEGIRHYRCNGDRTYTVELKEIE